MSYLFRPPVTRSPDLTRVLALPRRPPPDLEKTFISDVGALLYRHNPDCRCERACIKQLRPVQAWALTEAAANNGLLAPIGVGHGKTALDLLVAMVMPGCRQAVLLIPPGLREQLVREYLAWSQHFRMPSLVMEDRSWIVPGSPVVHVLPYSKLSRADATDALERLRPDLIIADEAHRLRHRNTATTGRVLRYWVTHPETRLVCWSGTLTSKSIEDYAHLSALSLKEGSPLPLDPVVVADWASAIDASDFPAAPGALVAFGSNLREGYHRRLVETPGVVATKAGAVDASVNLIERKPKQMPMKLRNMLQDLRGGWVRPDGEELIDAMSVARSARELASGFYYRWVFPGKPDPQLVDEWFAYRKAWHRELRDALKDRRVHLDSPLLLTKAAIRAHIKDYQGDLPVWRSRAWPAWRDIRDQVVHHTEAVWVDKYLVSDAAAWAASTKGVVWYEHDAFGRELANTSGLPCYGGGAEAEALLALEKGTRSIICSIKAHGTGRDGLQYLYREQLVANPPSSGAAWEQLLGRLHRIGQVADEVDTYVYRHTQELADAVDSAVEAARYIEGTMGTKQKLLLASPSWAV